MGDEYVIKDFFRKAVEAIRKEYEEIRIPLQTNQHFQKARKASGKEYDFFYDEKVFVYIIFKYLCQTGFQSRIKMEENYPPPMSRSKLDIAIYGAKKEQELIAAIEVKTPFIEKNKKFDGVNGLIKDIKKIRGYKQSSKRFLLMIVGTDNDSPRDKIDTLLETIRKKDPNIFLQDMSENFLMYNSQGNDLNAALALIRVNNNPVI
ncbi:MAG: hypothetical protein ACHQYP_04515 [Nitrospiria bacterium]